MKYSITTTIYWTILVLAVSILTSCASIFTPKYQKVTINKGKGVEVLVDGKKPLLKKGKYKLNKKDVGVQISASKDGFKTENKVVGTYKNHPVKTFVTLPLSAPMLFIPLLWDKGPKSKIFDKEVEIGTDLVAIPVREEGDKEIQLNKVTANIEPGNIKSRYFYTFKQYYRKEEKREAKGSVTADKIEVENTVFTDLFNNILKNSGFIDTTNKVLKNSYSNNLLINADVSAITFHQVYYNQMIYSDITIDWQVLDFYKKVIYETSTTTTSGEYSGLEKAYTSYNDEFKSELKEIVETSIEDAMEYGLFEFLADKEVKRLLKDNSAVEKEKNFTTITLPKSSKYIESVSKGINSGVTIKTKNGHGSGFVISSEGHIITNYHVIADREELMVITNDGKEYDVEVIRESKINDLALLKIAAKGLIPFSINTSKNIEIGKTVYAIGTPTSKSLSQSISKGIISGVRDSDFGTKLIQTDVSINSGNSGGAIIDKDGTVLGVVSAKLMGIGVEGVAFGIPAYEIYDKLKLK